MLTLNGNGHIEGLPGVYVKEAKVISIKDLSGKPTYNNDPNSSRDLAIEVEFDIGQTWNKVVIFRGNLKGNNGSQSWEVPLLSRSSFFRLNALKTLLKRNFNRNLSYSQRKKSQ